MENEILSETVQPKKRGPKPKRRKRPSLESFRTKLSAPSRPGFVRRWANDEGNRVEELQNRDYDFVEEKGISTQSGGSRVSRYVGTKPNGDPMHAYLMEVPEEYYKEDQEAKEQINNRVDEALRAGRDPEGRMDPSTVYGKSSID